MVSNLLYIFSFNQEKYIQNLLRSLNDLVVKPNKIIWLDDGSYDKTQEILNFEIEKYDHELKNIIVKKFNKENLGIYKNINRVFEYWENNYDYVHFLACDDWISEQYFSDFNKFVELNVKEIDEHIVCSNHISVTEDNRYITTNYSKKNANIGGLIRNKFNVRTLGMSKKLFSKLSRYDENIGVWADRLFDIKMLLETKKIYLINNAYHHYRIGTGYSRMQKRKENSLSLIKVYEKIITDFKHRISPSDAKYLHFIISLHRLQVRCNLTNYFCFIIQLIKNLNNNIDIKELKFIFPYFIFFKLKNLYCNAISVKHIKKN
jgi:glycosyltransferase involved in cell wall biosynthesis